MVGLNPLQLCPLPYVDRQAAFSPLGREPPSPIRAKIAHSHNPKPSCTSTFSRFALRFMNRYA